MRTVIVAAGVIFDHDRVLVTQRKVGDHLAGSWEFPGGKTEPGEDPRHAVVRELREELGVEVTVGEILDVAFHRYEEADKAVLLLFYEATLAADSPEPTRVDVADFAWRKGPELDAREFPPADLGVLEKVRRRIG